MFYSSSLADVAVSACQKKTTIHYLRLPLTSVKLGFNFFFLTAKNASRLYNLRFLESCREIIKESERKHGVQMVHRSFLLLFLPAASLSSPSLEALSRKPKSILSCAYTSTISVKGIDSALTEARCKQKPKHMCDSCRQSDRVTKSDLAFFPDFTRTLGRAFSLKKFDLNPTKPTLRTAPSWEFPST